METLHRTINQLESERTNKMNELNGIKEQVQMHASANLHLKVNSLLCAVGARCAARSSPVGG